MLYKIKRKKEKKIDHLINIMECSETLSRVKHMVRNDANIYIPIS